MEESSSSPSNRTSIGAIVLWKDPPTITHYFAGDAWWKMEDAIAVWVEKSKLKISCMKLRQV